MLLVKMAKYVGFCVYGRSYLISSRVNSWFYLSLRSITPQHKTTHHLSLSDAVRDRVFVQQVGAVAHSSATPAADTKTSNAEGVLSTN